MKQILFIALALSVFSWADFARDKNGIVTDSTTGLQWQDDAIGSSMLWKNAPTYCKTLSLDGDGWRLPSIKELKTIIVDSKASPSIADGFTQVSTYAYWSSTPVAGYTNDVWGMYLYYRFTYWDTKNSYCYVRCVRDKQ